MLILSRQLLDVRNEVKTMTPKQKLVEVVSLAVVEVLHKYKAAQLNLGSETVRFQLAGQVADRVLNVVNGKGQDEQRRA